MKRALKDDGKCVRNLRCIGNQRQNSEDGVCTSHNRNQCGGDLRNALDAAEQHNRRNDDNHRTGQIRIDAQCRLQSSGNGVGLRHVADAERCKGSENGEQNSQPLEMQTLFQIIHRAADVFTALIFFAEMHRKNDLRKFGHHTENGTDPHPKDRARTAESDCRGNTGDVARADRGCQCGHYSLKRRYTELVLFVRLRRVQNADRVFKDGTEVAKLHKTGTDCQKNTGADQESQHVRSPDNAVDETGVVGVKTEGKLHRADRVIVATGGKSYPLTGSTGDGYAWAQELGHKVTPLRASLVPLVCPGKTCPRLQGLPLKNVTLTIFENNKKLYEGFGEMLFTHFGISGPLVLSASSHMRKWDKATYRAEIDLKPALDEAVLDKRILSDFSQELNTDFRNSLGGLLPRKLIPIVVERTEIDPHQKVNAITKKQRQKLVQELKHFALDITQPGPIEDAIITSGGVSVKDIVPKTMESKKVPNLYFAGEIMDVDAYTGGFNLQIAWSTGYLAGLHAGSDRA